MTTIVPIVEGDGEVAALPILLRRLCQWLTPSLHVNVSMPIRVRRDRFLNVDTEFRRMLEFAASKCRDDGWILILLDADNDCPAVLGKVIHARAQAIVPHRRISVVLANREYEAWFIASAKSLDGQRGFAIGAGTAPAPESLRGAKEWLSARILNGKYREVTDQPAFSALMNLSDAQVSSRSFRKLCDEWLKNTVLCAQ
jgi:hypothetical protein